MKWTVSESGVCVLGYRDWTDFEGGDACVLTRSDELRMVEHSYDRGHHGVGPAGGDFEHHTPVAVRHANTYGKALQATDWIYWLIDWVIDWLIDLRVMDLLNDQCMD